MTQLVEDELRGLPPLPLEDEALLQTSQRLAQRLRAKGNDIHDSRDDRDAVLLHEIQHADTRTVGGERVALRALQLLGFVELLQSLLFNQNQIHWAVALVIGRMLSPGSER